MATNRLNTFIAAVALLGVPAALTGCKKEAVVPTNEPARSSSPAPSEPADPNAPTCQKPSGGYDPSNSCSAEWAVYSQKKSADNALKAEADRIKDTARPDPSIPDAQYAELDSGYQLATLFYALSATPPDYESLTSMDSEDYRLSSDEFKKHDLLQALRPKIDQQISAYKDPKGRYMWMTDPSYMVIGHYDFKTSSFPIRLNIAPGNTLYFRDAPKYKLEYMNGNDFLRLRVADEARAKQIEGMVALGNNARARIYVLVRAANTSNNQLQAAIVRVVINDEKHGEIARF